MKKPSKKELYERIAYLENENQKLREELNRQTQMEWELHISDAYQEAKRRLDHVYGNQLKFLHFVRVDSSGYWFSCTAHNDTFTYVVRHSEIKAKSV